MPATAKAALFFGPGNPFEIREVPIPEVEPEGSLIRVTHANVCGSDLHFWRGDAPLRLPDDGWLFGHEMTGRVARLGSKIKADSVLVWGSTKIVGVIQYDPWVIPRALDFLVRT